MSKKKLASSLPDGWEVYAEDEENQDYKAHKRVGDRLLQLDSVSAEALVQNVKEWEAAHKRGEE